MQLSPFHHFKPVKVCPTVFLAGGDRNMEAGPTRAKEPPEEALCLEERIRRRAYGATLPDYSRQPFVRPDRGILKLPRSLP